MNNWINYHHLLYFKTIAEEGSVSKAAEKLLLGQPTLSAQLKQFEDHLGVPLFERQHKKLILTEQGKIALDYARQIFKLGSEMTEVLNDKVIPTRIHVQIAALDSIPKDILLGLTQAAYKIDKCQISLIEGKAQEIFHELIGHRVDLAVANYIPTTAEAKLIQPKLIQKQTVSIFASSKFKHLKKDFPKSLIGQPFVMPTYDSQMRYKLEHWFNSNGITVDVIAETQDVSLKTMLAINSIGLIPAGSRTLNNEIKNGSMIELGKIPHVYEEIYLVSGLRKIKNHVAQELMKNFKI